MAKRQRTDSSIDGSACAIAPPPAQLPVVEMGIPPGPAQHVSEVASLCWLLQMPPVPPRFDVEAAVALGIPSGKLRSQLCAGKCITLPDGREVRPDEVLGHSERGERLLVADCPSVAHIKCLRDHSSLRASLPLRDEDEVADKSGSGSAEVVLDMVIHLSPATVCASAEYVAWCCSLPAATQHFFVGLTPQPQRFAFVTSARLQMLMHGLHATVFPLPHQMPPLYSCNLPAGLPTSSTVLDMLSLVVLRPKKAAGVDRSGEEKLVRWQDGLGMWNTLHEGEVNRARSGWEGRVGGLGRVCAPQHSSMHLAD